MRNRLLLLALAAVPLVAACNADSATGPCPAGDTCVAGTVHYNAIEGGFWAVTGDDKTTYDPAGTLPSAYQVEGLRVYLTARVRNDLAGIHMVGPIVDVVAIRKL